MGRFWFGAGLLIALLLGGWLMGQGISDAGDAPISALGDAAAAALAEDWAQATEHLEVFHSHWQNLRPYAAAVCRHEPVEQIDLLFAQLQVYGASRSAPEFAATAAGIVQTLKTLPVPHRFHWWNLL